MAYLEPQQLDIDTNDLTNGTLSKYLNFAKSRLKVNAGALRWNTGDFNAVIFLV